VIDRRRFTTLVAYACLFSPGVLRAQPATRVTRVGLLNPLVESTPRYSEGTAILLARLRDLGWIEGTNFRLETRWAGPDPDRQRDMAAELKALPVAVIVAMGTIPVRAARDGAPGVPVVMVNAGDPVGSGLVRSLSRPGGDLTGTSAAGEEVLGKQIELLSEAVPNLRRISVLMNSANPANAFFFQVMRARAKPNVQLDRIDVTTDGELDAAVARAKGGALVVNGDPMFYANRGRIVELTLRFKVPSIYNGREYVEAGGLMSYLSPNEWHWRTAAGFVDKILKGTKPADLPVMQPTEFKLVINLKTAKALDIVVPETLLSRTDEKI
jgi:putative ABC transport system substrate-binding protein